MLDPLARNRLKERKKTSGDLFVVFTAFATGLGLVWHYSPAFLFIALYVMNLDASLYELSIKTFWFSILLLEFVQRSLVRSTKLLRIYKKLLVFLRSFLVFLKSLLVIFHGDCVYSLVVSL